MPVWSVIYQLCSRPATGGPLRNRARSEFAAVLDQHLADVEFTPDNLPDLARRVFDYAQANPGVYRRSGGRRSRSGISAARDA